MAEPPADLFAYHMPRLRTLARALVHCDQTADDLVQDAWLAALRHPPRDAGRLGNWLAVLVRNFARRHARGEARRRRREASASRPEAGGDGAQDPDRFAAFRSLVAAIDTLDPRERRVVVMRFFEDLGAQDIAARLGEPVATVRTRLRRAVERLRARLDREHGSRAAWLPVFQSLLEPKIAASAMASAGGVASTGTAGGAGTVVAMKIQASHVGWAALLLAALGIFGFALAAPGDTLQPAVPAANAVTAQIASAPAAPSGLSAAGAAAVDPGERTAAPPSTDAVDELVAGRAIRSGDRAPVADVHLGVRVFDGLGGDPVVDTAVRCDRDGVFSVAVPHTLVGGRIVVRSLDARWLCGDGAQLLAVARARGLLAQLTAMAGSLHGVVRDAGGAPVAGARVAGNRCESIADANGAYRLPLQRGARSITVRAFASGHAYHRELVPLDGTDGDLARDIVLRPGVHIRGSVTDELGQPIAGASVSILSAFLDPVQTGPDGRYDIPFAEPAEASTNVSASHRGYLDAHRTVELDGREAEVDFVMQRGLVCTGRLVDQAGAPVSGAALYLRTENLNNREPDALSGADGRFRIDGAAPHWRHLAVEAPGFAILQRAIDVPDREPDFDVGTIALASGRTVEGTVCAANGQMLAGAAVFGTYGPTADDGDAMHRSMGLLTTTDADGRFTLFDMPRPFSLTIVCRGHVRTEIDDAQDRVAVVLHRKAGVAGTVVDDATGAPLVTFRVRFHTPSERHQPSIDSWWSVWSNGRPFEDAAGHWDTGDEEFEPGHWIGISVLADGYAPSPVLDVQTANEPRFDQVVVRLSRGARVEGTVVDGAGRPLPGAEVLLCPPTAHVLALQHGAHIPDTVQRVTTGADGTFVFAHVAAGPATLVAFTADTAPTHGLLAVPPQGTASATLVVEVGAAVQGRLRDERGDPVAGATVDLWFADADLRQELLGTARTDAEGGFTFSRLRPGTYWLRRAATTGDDGDARYYPAQRSFEVNAANARLVCDLDLHEGSGALHGHANGDASYVVIEREGVTHALLRIVRVHAGEFRVGGLAPGRYLVSHGTLRVPVELRSGAAAEVDLR